MTCFMLETLQGFLMIGMTQTCTAIGFLYYSWQFYLVRK